MDYRLQTKPEGRYCTIDINDAKNRISLKCHPCNCFRLYVAIVYILRDIGPFLKSAHIYIRTYIRT